VSAETKGRSQNVKIKNRHVGGLNNYYLSWPHGSQDFDLSFMVEGRNAVILMGTRIQKHSFTRDLMQSWEYKKGYLFEGEVSNKYAEMHPTF
jgi:hypothetical protein